MIKCYVYMTGHDYASDATRDDIIIMITQLAMMRLWLRNLLFDMLL